jgi:hypothetical protein
MSASEVPDIAKYMTLFGFMNTRPSRSMSAVVASDFRFAYFGTAAFAVRLLRLDQKLIDGIPMNPRRMANVLNTKPELQEFCGHLVKPGDETVTLFADGKPVEIPV